MTAHTIFEAIQILQTANPSLRGHAYWWALNVLESQNVLQ